MFPTDGESPFSAPLDIRFVGIIGGRYGLAKQAGDDGPAAVYACRTQSLSPTTAVIVGPVAHVGQGVGLLLDHVGLLNGQISRRFTGGFHVDLAGGRDEQSKLAAKINWLKKRNVRQAVDKRDAPRHLPRNPTAYFYLADQEHECFIIDASFSGVGISSKARPPVGTALQIGRIAGRVVRHMEVGFGVQFDIAQTAASIESDLNIRRGDDPA